MKKIFKKNLWLLLVSVLFVQNSFGQFDIPKKPDLQTSVYDYAGILDASQKLALEEKLIRYSDSTSTQIVIITVKTINGESIGLLTPKWAHEWGIGQANKDNGVLILLAEKEREIWISPGYGVEDKLSAGIVGQMTRDVIIPEFKAGSYYNGLDAGTDAIFKLLTGKYKEERTNLRKDGDGGGGGIIFFVIVFIIIIIILAKRGGGGGRGGRGGFGSTLTDILILSSLGRSSGGSGFGGGFGGGSSGGGGFGGGFGGGGFSGGGSGGSW
ncbi:TPM domain-containing protein [Flavobacterium sp. DG1-102-2]|uniref:TPM domain-containing protein n=1 Tax=Flavobacterium sp. DG1-102-2 TaxID=3081663 RepID=UPI003981AED9